MLPVWILIQNIENDEDRSFVEELFIKHNKVMYEKAYKILYLVPRYYLRFFYPAVIFL